MSNDYFNASGNPSARSNLSSQNMRVEFSSVATAFNKLPGLTGNGGRIAKIKNDATAMESSSVLFDDGSSVMVGASATRSIGGVTQRFYLESTDAVGRQGAGNVHNSTTAGGEGASLALGRSRGSALSAVTAVAVNDGLGQIKVFGADGTSLTKAATIEVYADGAVSTGVVPGRISFKAADASGVLTETARATGTEFRFSKAKALDGTSAIQFYVEPTLTTGDPLYKSFKDDVASTATGKGAALVGMEGGGTVQDAIPTVQLEAYRLLNVTVGGEERWDNAFTAAMSVALTKKMPIYLGVNPVVKYFTNTWDLSANDTSKDGLTIIGAGAAYSKPYFRNTTGACLEVQGVDRLTLRDFQIAGDCPVGIAGGRATVRQWNGHHAYTRVRVIMPDNMAANSGIGTIGLLGIEPEESHYDDCEFWANLPAILCPPNNISVQTFTTSGALTSKRLMTWTPQYTPIISTVLSNTVFRFTGGSRLIAYQPDSPCLVLRTVSSLDLGDTFLQMRGGGSNPTALTKQCPYGIDAENVWNFRWFGTFERGTDDTKTDVGFGVLSGSLENWTVSANAGTASSVTPNQVPAIYVVDFTSAAWKNCDFKIRLNSNQAQYPFGYSSTTTSGMQFQNCDFYISTTASLSTIPQPFLFNMSGCRIRLTGANATVPVILEKPTRYTQKLVVGKDLPLATAATVCTVVLPASGLSAGTVQFRNVSLGAGFVTGLAQTALMTGEFDVSWTRTQATTNLTVTVTRSSFSPSVKTAAASLDISAPTITAVLSGQASFQIQISTNLTGTSTAGVSTRMDADVLVMASLGINASTATVTTQ